MADAGNAEIEGVDFALPHVAVAARRDNKLEQLPPSSGRVVPHREISLLALSVMRRTRCAIVSAVISKPNAGHRRDKE